MLVEVRTSDKGMQRDVYSSARSEINSEASSGMPLQVLSSCEDGSKSTSFNGTEQSHSAMAFIHVTEGRKLS